ncbi:MAG: ParB/RepB/Spo0J family partition protein [Anaerolineales bacterium]|nr:ParB/RepB/Spo0J family partition protein [Anaerolineales bacterium]MCX7755763.1 ParB/RepB/Spo0J family partition protein [Anaerolineales bacterium]MDW8279021.1 ParB/RepB/Spo0J family partition protein [Anaerolineales bacterium]
MPKHSGLGKGLDALIPGGSVPQPPTAGESSASAVQNVPIESIVPNPRQPRAHFDPDSIEELAVSIREHGIIQPLLVSRTETGNGYLLIAGERRWQAAQRAGLREVPVIVRQTTDQERLELALIENIQRADLNPLEEANAYRQLNEEFHLSHEEIAARVGKSRVSITNTLRLLKLPPIVQQALVEGNLSEGHARALLGLNSSQAQEAAFRQICERGLTVRQTEELVNKLKGEKPAPAPKPVPPPDVKALQERLEASLGTRVVLKTNRKGGGVLALHYFSSEELDALLARLLDE